MVLNRTKHHIFVVDRNIFAEPYFCTLTFSNVLYRYYHSHTKRDVQAVSYNSLRYLQKHCVVGLQRHITLKNDEIHYRIPICWRFRGNIIFDLVKFFWWITWKYIMDYRNIFWNVDWRPWDSFVDEKLQNTK